MKLLVRAGRRLASSSRQIAFLSLWAGSAFLLPEQAASQELAKPNTPVASPADEKLRLLMERVRPNPASNPTSTSPSSLGSTLGPSAQHLQDRLKLLEAGEKALADMRLTDALQAFERAALILHAPDTEIALVRSYMQGGEYRRALAFVSHTAGAHIDTAAAAALYAWLLHLGGQSTIAQRLIAESHNRKPEDVFTKHVQQQLQSGAPHAGPELLKLPARLAPYTNARALPAGARVLASGVLLQDGKQALVPLTALSLNTQGKPIWLRNGLGQSTKATVSQTLPKLGLAVVQLQQPMPASDELRIANRTSFPGSVGYAVEYVASRTASPAWPILSTGFLGGVAPDGMTRKLGIDMPATTSEKLPAGRGGPVFDGTGALAGIALPGRPAPTATTPSPDRLVTISELPEPLLKAVAKSDSSSTLSRASVDQVYEVSLKHALQVIAVK